MDIGLLSFIYHAPRASANGKYIQKRKSPLPRRRADFYLIDMDVLSFLEAKSKIGGLPCKCHSDELLDELCFHLKHRLYLRKILEEALVSVYALFMCVNKHKRAICLNLYGATFALLDLFNTTHDPSEILHNK